MKTCKEQVNRGDFRWPHSEDCGRSVPEGHETCSFHEKVAQRRAEKDRAYNEKWRRGEELQAKARKLSEALGVRVDAHYSPGYRLRDGGYTGMMLVPLEWLEELARRKRSEP